MPEFGKFDFSGLKELQKKLLKLQANKEKFYEACIKVLAADLLKRVIKRTPVGHYPEGSGRNGGNLRRSWRMDISHSGGVYRAVISNAVPYAVYVEYGHRQTPGRYVPTLGKRLVKSWVPGKFMLTISEQELEQIAPQIISDKLDEFLGAL